MDQVIEAFSTGAGILWKALWALIFGYTISAGIQVLIKRDRMAKTLGERGVRETGLASVFGFISSSCSFAALAATRSVLVKGAHPINSVAFLIASTNLVIELGIVLWVLLGWRFVVANILLGLLMITYAYAITHLWFPARLADQAREHAEQQQAAEQADEETSAEELGWREQLSSLAGWRAIANAFYMEWKMAYKEILFGFTVAGFISVFVPDRFWSALFLHSGEGAPSALVVLENALIAPLVAFFTFIGSMGNVPLAALLWSKGAALGGVMAFLGADLVAATVVYLHAKYYGWRYAVYLSGLLYVCMVAAGLTVHVLFSVLGLTPTAHPALSEQVHFGIDYTFWLNIIFLAVAAALLTLHFRRSKGEPQHQHGGERRLAEQT